MTHTSRMRSAAILAALITGTAAQAEVTAADVWADWQKTLTVYGPDGLSFADVQTNGAQMTVSQLAVKFDDGITSFDAQIGDVIFTENGDGTVSIAMAESYPVTIVAETGVVINALVTQSDLAITVSGDPAELNYALSADSYRVELIDVIDGDVTFTGEASFSANDINGSYLVADGDPRQMTYGMNLASVDLLLDMEMPGEAGEYMVMSGKIDGMSLESDVSMPASMNMEEPGAIFGNGLTVDGGYTIDSANYIFDINADGSQLAGSVSTGASTIDVITNGQELAYDVKAMDMAVSFSGDTMPFPVEAGLAQYSMGFRMPTGKTEEPADFGLNIALVDLTVNEMIWNTIDPGAVLPRDPATLQFALAGTAKLLFDLSDPEQTAAMDEAALPGEIYTLGLSDLKIALAGALVTGTGDFTFDNTDLVTFDGMPRPEGQVNIQMSGVNGLIDKLIAMGLVPEEQAMGGRMMLGMFARSVGDDKLETNIEVNAEGHVLANGQRIR